MQQKPIIRKGDTTSHGGEVLEGLEDHLIHGKPIACKDHQVYCPLCKNTFPIIEGITSYTLKGRYPAVEGMKTACGATLIASQKELKIKV